MSNKALFPGIVVDEYGRALEISTIGSEAHYVIDDNGFRRHIEAELIDRQVLQALKEQIEANKDIVEQQMLKMIGKDDLFTKAAVDQSLGNMDQVLGHGLPDGALQWLGMMGFKIVVNLHGEIIKLDSPGVVDDSGEE